MRAAPDVLLIGEIRDRETMQSAIDLAGTGHLVLATLHSNNAAETLDRIINMFPQDQHTQVFMDLSQYLRAIIAQRLVRGTQWRRVAAVELMLNTPHVAGADPEGRHLGGEGSAAARPEQGMQTLRRRAAEAVQGRHDHARRSAVARRLAYEPRGEDQFGG